MKSFRSLRGGALALAIFPLLLAGCVTSRPAAPPPLLLISMDAFRWDYCALYPAETPHLRQLMREGISARSLIPLYPTNTFPNHYSIVTGLYPSHHGIINNDFFDPALGQVFHYNIPSSIQDGRWWGGEPVWLTAFKQGHKSATSFWVGSDVKVQDQHPTFWKPYDGKLPFEPRLEELMNWLHLPPDERPAVMALYLEETNSIGHKYGPASPELAAAVKLQDDRIGTIMDRLKAENLAVNFVIVSDHGMTPISLERVILLDDYLDAATVQLDFDGPVAGLRPLAGDESSLLNALASLQHARAYRTADLPARFHIAANPRNPPVWIVPDEGWEIYFRAKFDQHKDTFNKGEHGYDPAFASMQGILIAQGPSFKSGGTVVAAVENIHIYNLLCAALGLRPAPNDGDDRLIHAMLR